MQIGDKVHTPEGRGTILQRLDAAHPMRASHPTGWTYADGTVIEPQTVLYVVTLRDSHHAVYAEEELHP
mgnify:FL=1